MPTKTFKTTIFRDGPMCFIPVSFDPRAVFGKTRVPVKVTLNRYTYRSTIASMGGTVCIPLRKSNREAAGLEGGETITVKLELDAEARRRSAGRLGESAEEGPRRVGPLARARFASPRVRRNDRG
jgi:hypothetical protein